MARIRRGYDLPDGTVNLTDKLILTQGSNENDLLNTLSYVTVDTLKSAVASSGTLKPTYVDPAPVSGNYMTVDTATYGTVIITGNLTANFTLNLQADDFEAPENGVTYTASMNVIFTNSGSNTYGITGMRANGSWGGGDSIVSGTPAAGKAILAQVNLVVIGDGTANPDRIAYIAYTTIN